MELQNINMMIAKASLIVLASVVFDFSAWLETLKTQDLPAITKA